MTASERAEVLIVDGAATGQATAADAASEPGPHRRRGHGPGDSRGTDHDRLGRGGFGARSGGLGDDRWLGVDRHLWPAGRASAPRRGPVASLHVWWGDDRYVPRDHPLSNVKAFDDVLLGIAGREEGTAGGGYSGVPIPIENVHAFPIGEAIGSGRGAAWCAATLADALRAAELPTADGWPSFDLLLLGVGADGHLLSVFPGSPALDSAELAMAIPAPTHIEPHVERVTLNPAVVSAAREVLVVVSGADKASMVAAIFGSELDPRRWPAQLARRSGATWILDEAAASALPGR